MAAGSTRRAANACCAGGTRSARRCSRSWSATTCCCPVFPEPARRHGDMNRAGEPDPTSFTTPHSLTGAPAATVRCGTSPAGLPIGVQLVARPWRDDIALAAALRLERASAATGPRRSVGGWAAAARAWSRRACAWSPRAASATPASAASWCADAPPSSATASRRASRSSASSRLRCWERVSCATAVTRGPRRPRMRAFCSSDRAWEACTSKTASTRDAVRWRADHPGPRIASSAARSRRAAVTIPSLIGKMGMAHNFRPRRG